jgi:16S rRNA (cytosine1402-N4)-methyltransferase
VRIAVNRELETLEQAINKTVEYLNPKARVCVISFHSLEDRLVKLSFRRFASEGLANILTPKPLGPAEDEIEVNPSSRSAKLRVMERL